MFLSLKKKRSSRSEYSWTGMEVKSTDGRVAFTRNRLLDSVLLRKCIKNPQICTAWINDMLCSFFVSCLCHSSCGTVSNYTLPYIQHDRPCEIGLKFSVVRGISYELLALDWHLTVYKVFSKSIISQQPFKAGRKTRVTPI